SEDRASRETARAYHQLCKGALHDAFSVCRASYRIRRANSPAQEEPAIRPDARCQATVTVIELKEHEDRAASIEEKLDVRSPTGVSEQLSSRDSRSRGRVSIE